MTDKKDNVYSLIDTLSPEQKEAHFKAVRTKEIVSRFKANRLSLDDIDARAPQWICKNVVAENHMTMLAGEGGAGKSLMAVSIAAYITRVKERSVYYCSTETSFEGQVKAQFLARGGVKERFHLDRDEDTSMTDFDAFNEIMTDANADVMIIDHLFDYTPSGIDLNNAQEVVSLLKPLKIAVSQSNGKSVIVIHHLNGSGEIHGSRQIKAQFRHILKLTNSDESLIAKLVEVDKTNIGIKGMTMKCQIESMEIPGGDAGVMVFPEGHPEQWYDPKDHPAEQPEPKDIKPFTPKQKKKRHPWKA